MTDDVPSANRRRVVKLLGSSALAASVAGCTSGGDEQSPDDGDAPADDADGTPTGTAGDVSTATASDGGGTPSDGGSTAGGSNVRTPGPDEGRDWDAIAAREESSGFDLPDEAPTVFGFSRNSSENRLTISYGAMSGSDPMTSGTIYVLLVVEGSAEGVLVWEPTVESGDEILVGPDDSALAMDVSTVTALVFAWEYEGDLYVVDKKDQVF